MRRREFLAAASAAVMTVGKLGSAAEPSEGGRQIFELRTYHFASPAKRDAFEQFIAEAAVPAFNRAGLSPVGAWKLLAQDNPTLKLSADPDDLWLLLPHNSLESVATLEDRLAADEVFQSAGRQILKAPKSDPAYTRYQSTLLLAMRGVPRVAVPTKAPTRVFELRTYESQNVDKARNKLEMFNEGEFPIFGRAGMPGVFFGGAIAGADLPQLTYMIVTNDIKDVKMGWSAFFNDPQWKTLSANPAYKDNVSKVISRFLRPCSGSQI